MGSWGVKLYDNDVCNDVREYYIDGLRLHKTEEEIINGISEEFIDSKFYDEDENSVVILSLADTMWDYGRLTEKIKKEALMIIDNRIGLGIWPSNLKEKRIKELEKIKKKLLSNQPKEKKIKILKPVKGNYNYLDVLLFKIENIRLGDLLYSNLYVVLRVEGIQKISNEMSSTKNFSHVNVCSIYNVVFKREPSSKEIDKLNDDDYLYIDEKKKEKYLYSLFFSKKFANIGNPKIIKRIYDEYDENYNHVYDGFSMIIPDYQAKNIIAFDLNRYLNIIKILD